MRLKTFSAPSMSEAMLMVKEHFGENAIIVSSQGGENGQGVRVTAAIDAPEEETHDGFHEPVDELEPLDVIAEALAHHGVPAELAERILTTAEEVNADDPELILAAALDRLFRFEPLRRKPPPPVVMLVGLPGAGKTVTAAKIATRAVLARQPIHVITTDTVRAGGFAQLEAFTKLLKLKLLSAGDPLALAKAVSQAPQGALIVVDCAGGNPYDKKDHDRQKHLIQSVDAEVVLVMAAGGDPMEAMELADIYRAMGARKMIVTRIDMSRRFGAMLGVADETGLAFAEIGTGPSVSKGLKALNPVMLARLLLPASVTEKHGDTITTPADEVRARARSA